MLECCILFAHHNNDDTTRHHLQLLRERNPYPVIAICNNAEQHTERALDVSPLSKEGPQESGWHGHDTMLYQWFLHGGVRAQRYIYFEWDTLATMPVREFYDEVWDQDAAASTVKHIENDPNWYWFWQRDRLPEDLRVKAGGIVPFNGIILSHRALAAITTRTIPADVFCELRIGTLLRNTGFEPCSWPAEKQSMNSYDRNLIQFDPDRPGIYHPIK